MENFKYLLLIGGTGVLGSAIVKMFKNNSNNWKICVIDYAENKESDFNIILDKEEKYNEQFVKKLNEKIEAFNNSFQCIINVAGGWLSGSVKSTDIFEQTEDMMNKNYMSSLLACHLATRYLSEEGLLLLTGAAKVFKETNADILAYQVAKTAAHTLALTLKDSNDLPKNSTIITILPEIIDTPSNRLNMPLEDFSKWTKPEGIAALLKMWADGFNRPKSGAFGILKAKDNYVIPEFV